MKIILLGPPGSGKGTVSQRLAKDFNLRHVSTGVILREEIKKDSPLGNEIKGYVESGGLVPDETVIKILKQSLENEKDYILDGFPRSINQAESIDDLGVDMVIYLEVPDEVVIERFSGRRTDPQTDMVYHIKYNPAPEEVQERLIIRKDDTPEVVKDRLKIYHDTTKPVIDYYKNKGVLKTVDGAPPPEPVYVDVKKVVEEFSEN